jgi:parafibromin
VLILIQDFSHVRKLAQPFMSKKPMPSSNNISTNPSLALNQKPQRRPDPIILLSPSASALLRMSNVKSFLESGHYIPPDNSAASPMLHLSRMLKDIDPNRPMRFILVEGPEQFKPEYWNRVVAVFTTGQAWQFKNYRWSDPSELFKHVLGVYMGWRGDQLPETVRGFGSRVMPFVIDKWRDPKAPGAETGRWRDREVVESIWKSIESNMRAKGWRKDAAPVSI